jgi:hypothetical protein
LHRIDVSRWGATVKFDGFGDLPKALTFSPERAACVAKCRVSEHVGLIHALDVGHDLWPQQQSTLFDQLGHFREAQLGIAEDLRGTGLAGLGYGRIFRVHLPHGLFQGCHVIDHRKTSPAIIASTARLLRRCSLAQQAIAVDQSCEKQTGAVPQRYQRSLSAVARASCHYHNA